MTNDEIAAAKKRIYVLFLLGIASFIGAYMVPEDTTVELIIGVALVLTGVLCMVVAGKIAKSLKPENAAK